MDGRKGEVRTFMQLSKRVLQSVQVGARGVRVLGFDGRERARLVRAVMRRGSVVGERPLLVLWLGWCFPVVGVGWLVRVEGRVEIRLELPAFFWWR